MYKLGGAAAVGLLVYVCGMIAAHLGIQIRFHLREGLPGNLVVFLPYLFLVNAAAPFVVLACLCYIYVGRKAARPYPLHWHGVVLMMLLMEAVTVASFGKIGPMPLLPLSALVYAAWAARRSLFLLLMIQKMAALGPPVSRWSSVRCWGLATVGATLVLAYGVGAPAMLYNWYMVLRGTPFEEAHLARTGVLTGAGDVGVVDRVVLGSTFLLGVLALTVIFIGSLGFIVASHCAMRTAISKLIQRDVSKEMLTRVETLVKQQFLGVLAGLATNCIRILGTALVETVNTYPFVGNLANTVAFAVDTIGDVVGILLLSGIGALIFRENPEAGDIGANIRSMLHAAVLTSRADSVFEGVVQSTASNCCIVSFPGKYIAEWNALTWLCEQGHLSSACVFLPQTDPKERFGCHFPCPETPGKCWCHQLYGESKLWGCAWFEAWRVNVEKAVELELDLVVVFFPRQSGDGVVKWEELGTVNLWDGNGLGGSQKSEVAFLNRMGYPLIYEGLDQTRRRISRRQIAVTSRPRTELPTPLSPRRA